MDEQQEHITKVKVGEKILFVRIRPDRPTEFVYVECKEEPRPEFDLALGALVPIMIEQCGLEKAVWKEAEICSVSFTHTGLGELGFSASIKLRREMKAPLTQDLPYVPAADIDMKLQFILKRIVDEAWLYIKGDRKHKQTDLFAPQERQETAP